MKRFIFKIYDNQLIYKKTIRDDILLSKISFDYNINGGQGGLNLDLNLPFNDNSINNGYYIKVFLYDDNFNDGLLIYNGIIEEIIRKYNDSENKLELQCQSIASLFTRTIYESGGKFTFTKDDDPANIIKDIISDFNTKYNLNINTDNIEDYGTNIKIEFDYINSLDAIKKIQELTDFYFLITPDLKFYFGKNTNINYIFTSGYDLQNVEINEDGNEIFNKVIVTYDDGGTEKNYITLDNASIIKNGLFQKHFNKTELKDLTSATEFGNNELEKNKNNKQKIELEINDRYLIENIIPGGYINISNINYNLKNIQINKIQYKVNTIIIYLSTIDSVGKILLNN